VQCHRRAEHKGVLCQVMAIGNGDSWLCRRADLARALRVAIQVIFFEGSLIMFLVVSRGGARRPDRVKERPFCHDRGGLCMGDLLTELGTDGAWCSCGNLRRIAILYGDIRP
jgi:hypothetical protein